MATIEPPSLIRPRGRADREEGTGQREIDDGAPLDDGHVGDQLADPAAGVGHRDVESAESFERKRGQRFGTLVVGDVAVQRGTSVFAIRSQGSEPGVVDVAHHDLCTVVEESLDDRSPNACDATRDECDPTVEPVVGGAQGHAVWVARNSAHSSPCSSATVAIRRHRSTWPPRMFIPNVVRVRNSRTTTPSAPASYA